MADKGEEPPNEDNIVPFSSRDQTTIDAEKIAIFASKLLGEVRDACLKKNGDFFLNDYLINAIIRLHNNALDKNFSHSLVVKHILVQINTLIGKFTEIYGPFKDRLQDRRNQIAMENARKLAELQAKKLKKKFDEYEMGEFAEYDDKGKPTSCFINAQLAFKALDIVGRFNEMSERKDFRYKGNSIDTGGLRNIMFDEYHVDFSKRVIEEATDGYCKRYKFHPIKEYFDSIAALPWKGVIDTWLTVTLGAEDTPLNREIGRKMLVAMVTRIYQPGAKFDQMIVLEGPQGLGKSSLLEKLCGREYFNSGKILTMESKEQMEALKGRMIYESADLVGHGRAGVDETKAFLSKTSDNGRWAYAPTVEDHPRTAIIVGTTNKDAYLLDDTGNRRIWPVQCCVVPTAFEVDGALCPKEADQKWLDGNRDQLFSEALKLYKDGYSLVMDRTLWGTVTELQQTRMADVPGVEFIPKVFGFTETEGMQIIENKDAFLIEVRLSSLGVIENLFPHTSNHQTIGRVVKAAMLAFISSSYNLKFEYIRCILINKRIAPGYKMIGKGKEEYDYIKSVIEIERELRRTNSISSTDTKM